MDAAESGARRIHSLLEVRRNVGNAHGALHGQDVRVEEGVHRWREEVMDAWGSTREDVVRE